MQDTKAVYVTTYELDGNLNSENEFSRRIVKIENDSFEATNERTKDFGCQYDFNNICTCKRIKRKEIRYYSSRQVYRSLRYLNTRGHTEIGVGDVKTLPRKRVRRIYLPNTVDAGVGSWEFTAIPGKTQNCGGSYYDQKKTSSKCVGGVMDCTDILVINEKLSPIVQTKSGSNSPKVSLEKLTNISKLDNGSTCEPTEVLQAQVNILERKERETIATSTPEASKNTATSNKIKDRIESSVQEGKLKTVNISSEQKDFSSDSLVQHVHNLENPSDYKQSRISIDIMENKLEREYRKIFSTKPKERKPEDEKTASDFKSTSTLRKRFEALRRGINKKDETKTDSVSFKISSRVSIPSKKDVSIVSDPPSLQARSYSNTKIFSPMQSRTSPTKKGKAVVIASKKSFIGEKSVSNNWSTDNVSSDQGVKGMLRLWGKKFNLDESNHGKVSPENLKSVKGNKVGIAKEDVIVKEKKQTKRFSFFRRKNKDKSKQSYKPRKSVTAGRCEVDGLMIKIGAANEYPPEPPIKQSYRNPVKFDGILRRSWLQRYLGSSVDSKHSAQIRWNNNMYSTSSSTVFELIDCVYKNTGIVFKSKSEMTTAESSYYQSFVSPQINFMQQNIQAWMVPRIIRDKQIVNINKNKKENKNIEVTYSNQKWFIEKSKAFGHNIEVVLHSKNFVEHDKGDSSEYIMIDIPKGYFSQSSSDEVISQASDEQVYNIVEYEIAKSISYLKKRKKDKTMDTGDYTTDDIQVTVSVKDNKNNKSNVLETVIKRPPLHRDVVVQGSNVYVPKRCDVIGVGIITQREIRDIKKPILKIQDELTDESEHILPPQKKCEFAESYLQDYYKNWTPLGLDLYSWCVSDSQLRVSSDSLNSLNQGDGSKSCPNIFDDYQASTIVSSCNTSSCSHCLNLDNDKKDDQKKGMQLFKFNRKKSETRGSNASEPRRFLPKDSIEVFRQRKLYALSNRGIWACMDTGSEPYCVPSNEDKEAQHSLNNCPPECRPETKSKKQCKKHVSMPSCDVMNDMLQEQLQCKATDGILAFKSGFCDGCKKSDTPTKHARVIPQPTCEMPHHPSSGTCCKKKKTPQCANKSSSSLSVIPSPTDKCFPPPPCAKPSPPPCAKPPPPPSLKPSPPPPCEKPSPPPCVKPPQCPSPPPCPPSPPCPPPQPCCAVSKQTSPISSSRSRPKPIPPKIHSPPIPHMQCPCSPKEHQSPCNSPQCSIQKWSSNPPTPPCMVQSRNRQPKKRSASCQISPPIMKYRKCPSKEFPWPLKKMSSYSPSQESRCSRGSSKTRRDNFTCPPAKPKDCTPQKVAKGCKQKMAGLHLKKLPIPKCPSDDSFTSGVIRLTSQEKITVKLRRPTDSTEEIREGCNVKVQDEDGHTMYERRNYRRNDSRHLVQDLYRDSRIHRVATENNDIAGQNSIEQKTCNSVPNIIEINLNLQFKQGDKSKGKYKNYDAIPKDLAEVSEIHDEASKEVYVVRDQQKQDIIKPAKKDLDIKIVIKNYKPDTTKSKPTTNYCVNREAEEFAKKISVKFQTVSTGYSDIFEQQAFPVHRTTINLTDSKEKQKDNDNSKDLTDEVLQEIIQPKHMKSDVILTKESTTINTVSSLERVAEIVKEDETKDDKFEAGSSTTDNEYDLGSKVKPKSTDSIPKLYTKNDKKAVLKQIFEHTGKMKKKPNKSKMQKIRRMLRAVLTSDSSAHEDIAVNNELANELTYDSLKPNYFKNTESMTNYYLDDSATSLNKNSHTDIEEAVYPSSEENSGSSDEAEAGGCLCTHIATKLNLQDKNCCCCRPNRIDQEIVCDLIDGNYNRYKHEYVDVQTQDSKYINTDTKSKVKGIGTFREDDIHNRSRRVSKQQIHSPHPSSVKSSQVKRYNRATVLGISDDDKIILLNSTTETSRRHRKSRPADILQSQETKKAVLEIYAEKTVSSEHVVARLPKFAYNKESEICHYQEVVSSQGRSTISQRDVIMMSFIQ